jgi:hypothetical protein
VFLRIFKIVILAFFLKASLQSQVLTLTTILLDPIFKLRAKEASVKRETNTLSVSKSSLA